MKPEPQQFRRGGGGGEPQAEIQIAGVITGLKVAKSEAESGELYAQAVPGRYGGEDRADLRFRRTYEKLAEKLKIDVPVVMRGSLRGEEDAAPKLSVSCGYRRWRM